MPSVFDLITSSLDSQSVGRISQQLGKDTGATENAINAALPMLLGAVQKSAQKDSAAGLAQALNSVLDGEADMLEKKAPGVMGALGGFLDADGDGDTDLSDILSHGAKSLGGLFR